MAKKERVRRIRAERSKTTLGMNFKRWKKSYFLLVKIIKSNLKFPEDMSYHPRVQSAPRSKSEKNQSQDGSRKNSLEAKARETQKQKIKSLASVKVRIL